jgi:uncharacterized protein
LIIVDAGFLVALADSGDRWNKAARLWTGSAAEGWVTTWPVLAEACRQLGDRRKPEFAAALVDDAAAGGLQVWSPAPEATARLPGLMGTYARLPMDLGDASLVLLAEYLSHGRILTTDVRAFGIYRWNGDQAFTNLLETTP